MKEDERNMFITGYSKEAAHSGVARIYPIMQSFYQVQRVCHFAVIHGGSESAAKNSKIASQLMLERCLQYA